MIFLAKMYLIKGKIMISKGDSLLRQVIFEMKAYDFHFSNTRSTTWSHIRKWVIKVVVFFSVRVTHRLCPN